MLNGSKVQSSSKRDPSAKRSGIPALPSYGRSTPSGGGKFASPLRYQSPVPTKIPHRNPRLDMPLPAVPQPLRPPQPTGTSQPSASSMSAPALPRTKTRMSEPPPTTLKTLLPRSNSSSKSDIASVLLAFPTPPSAAAHTPTKRVAPLSLPPHLAMGATPSHSQVPRPRSCLSSLKRSSTTPTSRIGEKKKVHPINTASQRASLTVSSPTSKRGSTSSLVDVRPVSAQFSPTNPPRSPLPAVPKELPALPQLVLTSSKRPLSKITGPSTAPTLSSMTREKIPSRSCSFPLPPSIEVPTPKLLSSLREDEVEDLFDTPVHSRQTSSRSRVSSVDSQASRSNGSVRGGLVRPCASSPNLARKRIVAEEERVEHLEPQTPLGDVSDGTSHSTGESSEIDIDASLDASAWRAGVMAKELMAIDSEDDETQAECVRELTLRLSMARQNQSVRGTSPQQRRLAHTVRAYIDLRSTLSRSMLAQPYKIVRKPRSQHFDSDSDGYTLSEEEENFDLSLDYGSSLSPSHKIFSSRSLRSRSSTSSSYGEQSTSCSPGATLFLQRQSSREKLWQTALDSDSTLGLGANVLPSSGAYSKELSDQELAGAPEQDFWSPSGHCNRSLGSSTSTRIDTQGQIGNNTCISIQDYRHQVQRHASVGMHDFQSGSTDLRPLRTYSSTSSLKPLATVARLQQVEGSYGEKRLSNLTRSESYKSNAMLRLHTQTLAVNPSAPSPEWTGTFRSGSITPKTPLSPIPCGLPSSPSGPFSPTRRLSLKPLRTSQSSSVLCGSVYEVVTALSSTNLNRSSSTSYPSRPLGAIVASGMTTGTASHGRRMSRSIPYVSTQVGTTPLILPGLAEAAPSF
ncbi:BZ3500_MvSof-1268-A1-R1_Chr1-1g01032 [Microbotryum saponariae]|uniref:BZ3500_MvSof-1268-A1-R1_Chr1-1g01032 protein n=1 Tax=Microbotryum saponariae TaxID=289078 RepID=A0A2X0KSQ5_9BASI|nr:BZ3500_MvSof-1268-A1-R1_Chr1-1g01032 [Microbotryum saponariae]SCZ93235.1 BZ3501_MvSof-1269-A2-R1_Chr1-1g00629 [Microbotryum saponariae]